MFHCFLGKRWVFPTIFFYVDPRLSTNRESFWARFGTPSQDHLTLGFSERACFALLAIDVVSLTKKHISIQSGYHQIGKRRNSNQLMINPILMDLVRFGIIAGTWIPILTKTGTVQQKVSHLVLGCFRFLRQICPQHSLNSLDILTWWDAVGGPPKWVQGENYIYSNRTCELPPEQSTHAILLHSHTQISYISGWWFF